METISALLAIFVRGPPVTGGCPSNRPTLGRFDVFIFISPDKMLSMHSSFRKDDIVQWSHHGHDDVIKWKHFPRNWPFVRGSHPSPVNSPHKGQWRGALMFTLICARINGWVNTREAGDSRRYRPHYDVIVMVMHQVVICFHCWLFEGTTLGLWQRKHLTSNCWPLSGKSNWPRVLHTDVMQWGEGCQKKSWSRIFSM